MNMEELLARWREDDLSEAELNALTQLLDQPAHRERLMDDWLVDFALPEVLGAAATRAATPQPIPAIQSRRVIVRRSHLPAAIAACAALLLGGVLILRLLPRKQAQDLNAAFASVQESVLRAPIESPSPMPEWMSPTASLLEPLRLSSTNNKQPL